MNKQKILLPIFGALIASSAYSTKGIEMDIISGAIYSQVYSPSDDHSDFGQIRENGTTSVAQGQSSASSIRTITESEDQYLFSLEHTGHLGADFSLVQNYGYIDFMLYETATYRFTSSTTFSGPSGNGVTHGDLLEWVWNGAGYSSSRIYLEEERVLSLPATQELNGTIQGYGGFVDGDPYGTLLPGYYRFTYLFRVEDYQLDAPADSSMNGTFSFELNTIATPEPGSTLALLSIALLISASFKRESVR